MKLIYQVKLVNEAIRSVSAGEELAKQFFRLSVGQPLPADHMPNYFKLLSERLWRIFRIHDDFNEMSANAQQSLVKT